MSISLATSSPDPRLLAAVREAAWDQRTTTVVVDYDTAGLGGMKKRWQIAFNEAAGEAAVINLDGESTIHTVKAGSVPEAAANASRLRI